MTPLHSSHSGRWLAPSVGVRSAWAFALAAALCAPARADDPRQKSRPTLASCDSKSQDVLKLRDKAFCYLQSESPAAIARLHEVARRLATLHGHEDPDENPDNSVVFRQNFYYAAENAGVLAAKHDEQGLMALAASADPYSRRFALAALGHMLRILGYGYARGATADRERLAQVRRPVAVACARQLTGADNRVVVDALALCLEVADDGEATTDAVLDALVTSTDDAVRRAAVTTFVRIVRTAWPDGATKIRRLVPVLSLAMPQRWTHDGVAWRETGCRVVARYMKDDEQWGKPALLRASLEIGDKNSEAAATCAKLAARFPGPETPAAPIPAPTQPPAPRAAPIPDLPLDKGPPIVCTRAPALTFRRAPPPAPLTLRWKNAERVAYAPDGTTHVTYGGGAASIFARRRTSPRPGNNNVLDIVFSRDSSRVVFIGATTPLEVVDVASGRTLHSAGMVEAAAFVGGDPRRLVYVESPGRFKRDKTRVFRLDDPYTDLPRRVLKMHLFPRNVWFSADGRRLFVHDERETALLLVDVEAGTVQRLARQVEDPLPSPDGRRVCYKRRAGAGPPRCVRPDDGRVEILSGCESLEQFSGDGEKLLLRCDGRYALADLARSTVTPLEGVEGHSGGGVALTWGGSGVACGAESFFDFFDLRTRRHHRVTGGQGLFSVKAIPGKPAAIAAGGENDAGFKLYLFSPR